VKKFLYLLLFTSYIFSTGCNENNLNKKRVNVAVAANVSYAIDELIAEFNKIYPDIEVQVSLGSSGKLTAQIKNSAPYQIFMSANMLYPETLYRDKIAITEPVIYAKGGLALLSKKGIDLSKGLELLRDKSINRVAIANPKTAPYGVASFEALKRAKIFNAVKEKFVYGESISQTVSYTVTATDIGLIAKSSLFSPNLSHFKEGVNWITIENSLYTPIKQGIVILKAGQDREEVKLFYDFILSKKAETVLKRYGYM